MVRTILFNNAEIEAFQCLVAQIQLRVKNGTSVQT